MRNRRPLVTLIAAVILIGAAAYFARSHKPAPSIELTALPTQTPTPTPVSAKASRPAVSQTATQETETGPDVSAPLAAQFESIQKQALDAIPTQSQLMKLDSEQAHFTPKSVLEAAIKIGDLAQMVKDHPELSNKGLEFYRQCAEASTSPTSIRASCYADFKRLMKAHPSAVTEPQVAKPVKDLAQKIMS